MNVNKKIFLKYINLSNFYYIKYYLKLFKTMNLKILNKFDFEINSI